MLCSHCILSVYTLNISCFLIAQNFHVFHGFTNLQNLARKTFPIYNYAHLGMTLNTVFANIIFRENFLNCKSSNAAKKTLQVKGEMAGKL